MTDSVVACALETIPNGGQLALELEGQPLLLLRAGGEVHAVENRCPHLDLPLAGGRRIGCELICPHHGARFALGDGRALAGAAISPIKTFRTRIVEGQVEVIL